MEQEYSDFREFRKSDDDTTSVQVCKDSKTFSLKEFSNFKFRECGKSDEPSIYIVW